MKHNLRQPIADDMIVHVQDNLYELLNNIPFHISQDMDGILEPTVVPYRNIVNQISTKQWKLCYYKTLLLLQDVDTYLIDRYQQPLPECTTINYYKDDASIDLMRYWHDEASKSFLVNIDLKGIEYFGRVRKTSGDGTREYTCKRTRNDIVSRLANDIHRWSEK